VQNFHIFIVSAVDICKQCLQTASASGGRYPWTPLGEFHPADSLSYNSAN